MSSVASSDEDADYDLTRKHLYLPSGKRIKLKSPRFLASLAANGVVLAELEEPSIDPFYERAAGNWELAEREWTVANTTRRENLDLVVGHRAARIKEASEEKAPKPDGEPLANELLSGASLIALEKEHVSRVLQKRAKKQAFEAAQSELFAARHNETVQSAHKKHSRAQAFRAKVKEEERAHYQEKSQVLAQKQQRAKEGFERWEEHKEEQRRQMQRRDEETAARNYGRLREPRRAWRVGVRVCVCLFVRSRSLLTLLSACSCTVQKCTSSGRSNCSTARWSSRRGSRWRTSAAAPSSARGRSSCRMSVRDSKSAPRITQSSRHPSSTRRGKRSAPRRRRGTSKPPSSQGERSCSSTSTRRFTVR